ncbi:hypothetical protein GY45DRAFT_544803 [Cubamyces sp. BRFM 1775]|nr:hypothetical protein GY45DRAFT_544803 [Cubamyces sp. BRFM 1775]
MATDRIPLPRFTVGPSGAVSSGGGTGKAERTKRLAIGVGVGGGVAGALLVLGGIWWCRRRSRLGGRSPGRHDAGIPSYMTSDPPRRGHERVTPGLQSDGGRMSEDGAGPSLLHEKTTFEPRDLRRSELQPNRHDEEDYRAALAPSSRCGTPDIEQVDEADERGAADIPRIEFLGARRVRREVDAGSVHLPSRRGSHSDYEGTLSTLTLPPAYDELPARSRRP